MDRRGSLVKHGGCDEGMHEIRIGGSGWPEEDVMTTCWCWGCSHVDDKAPRGFIALPMTLDLFEGAERHDEVDEILGCVEEAK